MTRGATLRLASALPTRPSAGPARPRAVESVRWTPWTPEKLERLPDRPGVYLYKDAKGQVVYVGKAASIRARVRSYFQASRTRDAKTDALVDHIADLDYIVTATSSRPSSSSRIWSSGTGPATTSSSGTTSTTPS